MKIDADAGGSVDWPEFMNYMLLENYTLSAMNQKTYSYIRNLKLQSKHDPPPGKSKLCHSQMITAILVLIPDDVTASKEQLKRKLKYITSSRDGSVKVWEACTMRHMNTIQVTNTP